jgi:ribosomal protein L17
LTTKELNDIVAQNSLAIAENTRSIAQLVQNSLILHESIKALENTALAHDAQIDELIESGKRRDEAITNLEKQWQAYLNRLPQN